MLTPRGVGFAVFSLSGESEPLASVIGVPYMEIREGVVLDYDYKYGIGLYLQISQTLT